MVNFMISSDWNFHAQFPSKSTKIREVENIVLKLFKFKTCFYGCGMIYLSNFDSGTQVLNSLDDYEKLTFVFDSDCGARDFSVYFCRL